MRVAVIVAGIAGITTAYELAALGQDVVVFEQLAAAAERESFSNGGLQSAVVTNAWHRPSAAGRTLGQGWARASGMRMSRSGLGTWSWLWRWSRAQQPSRYRHLFTQWVDLARHSRLRQQTLMQSLGLEVETANGVLILLRQASDQAFLATALPVLHDLGLPFAELNPEQAREIEPALRSDTPFSGAVHLPEDTVGNCRQFTLQLKLKTENMGVDYRFSQAVEKLTPDSGAGWQVQTPAGVDRFDAVVVCAGQAGLPLVRPLGLNWPQQSVTGYTVSAPLREPLDAPRSAIYDERYMVSIARVGQRLRVSGGFEFGGDPKHHAKDRLELLYRVLDDWFPGAGRAHDAPQVWKGTLPLLPDGLPLVGQSDRPGLWLNTAHGNSGWTLANGIAIALAEQISGRKPSFDLHGLGPERLRT